MTRPVAGALLLMSMVAHAAAGQGAPIVSDSAGVEIVSVQMGAVEPTTLAMGAPRIQIGAIDGSPAYAFGGIWDAAKLPSGGFVVVDGQTFEIRVFDAGGRHVRTFGRHGDGPAEFGGPPWIAIAGDTILAWDAGHYRLSRYGLDGALLQQVGLLDVANRLGVPWFANGLVWEVAADGRVIWSGHGVSSRPSQEGVDRGRKRIALVHRESGAPIDFGEFPGSVTSWIDPGNGTGLRGVASATEPRVQGRLPPPPWVAAISAPESWEVRLYGPDGNLSRIIRAAVQREPASVGLRQYRSELPTIVDRLGISLAEARQALDRIPVPDSLPAIGDLFWDRADRLWVGRYPIGWLGGVRVYDVIDRGGVWRGTVEMPPHLERVLEVGSDYLLAVTRDDFDVPYLHEYPLALEGDGG